MPIYKYTAKDIQGKEIKGEISGDSEQHVLSELRLRKLFPLRVVQKKVSDKESIFRRDLFKPKIKKKHIAIFTRQFASMLKAGIPLTLILDVLIKQERNLSFKEVLESINSDILKGNTLSASMAKFDAFPQLLISMAEVGETNGRLDIAFGRVAANLEKDIKLAAKIKNALMYPMVLLTVTIMAGMLLSIVVLPKFAEMFDQLGAELPATTKVIIGFSEFMGSKWYMVLAAVVLIIILLVRLMNEPKIRKDIDRMLLKLPVFGRAQNIVLMARFCRTFSSLVESGVSVIVSLEIVKNVINNLHIKNSFDSIIQDVQTGTTISQAVAKFKIFTPLVVSTVKIGEESGNLGEVLDNTADLYENESETQLQRLTAMVEPMVTVIMALGIGFLVISIIQPMFGMYSNIGR